MRIAQGNGLGGRPGRSIAPNTEYPLLRAPGLPGGTGRAGQEPSLPFPSRPKGRGAPRGPPLSGLPRNAPGAGREAALCAGRDKAHQREPCGSAFCPAGVTIRSSVIKDLVAVPLPPRVRKRPSPAGSPQTGKGAAPGRGAGSFNRENRQHVTFLRINDTILSDVLAIITWSGELFAQRTAGAKTQPQTPFPPSRPRPRGTPGAGRKPRGEALTPGVPGFLTGGRQPPGRAGRSLPPLDTFVGLFVTKTQGNAKPTTKGNDGSHRTTGKK